MIVVGAAVLVLMESPRSCAEQLADSGPVTVCEKLTPTSLEVLVVVVVLLALLWSDLSELEVPGVARFTRRLEDVQAETERSPEPSLDSRPA